MARNDCLHFAEMEVFGYHTMSMPTSSPTPTLVNLSVGKRAEQLSTYYNLPGTADKAVDGDLSTYSHTDCFKGEEQWWEVDLGEMYTIASIDVGNRLNCCGGRLHDFYIFLKDENGEEVDVLFSSGPNGNYKTHAVDHVFARYIRIQLGDQDCLQLGEVLVKGW